MREATLTEISRLVTEGASLDEVEAFIEARTRGLSDEQLSAAWLRDWLVVEHAETPGSSLVPPGRHATDR